jgi:hypothetical protein
MKIHDSHFLSIYWIYADHSLFIFDCVRDNAYDGAVHKKFHPNYNDCTDGRVCQSGKRRKCTMSDYFSIPLEVLGYGIVISMGVAALIKVLMMCISKFAKN